VDHPQEETEEEGSEDDRSQRSEPFAAEVECASAMVVRVTALIGPVTRLESR
jgi:hypothetical protein